MLNFRDELLDSIIQEVVNLNPNIDQAKLQIKLTNVMSMYRVQPIQQL